jgi:hypothetical protein
VPELAPEDVPGGQRLPQPLAEVHGREMYRFWFLTLRCPTHSVESPSLTKSTPGESRGRKATGPDTKYQDRRAALASSAIAFFWGSGNSRVR